MSHTKPIDLGHKPFDSAKVLDINDELSKTQYPHLRLDEIADERLGNLEVGKKGSAEIRFKVLSKNKREDGEGERHSVVLEITSIEPGHDPKFNGKKTTNWVEGARESFRKNFKDS